MLRPRESVGRSRNHGDCGRRVADLAACLVARRRSHHSSDDITYLRVDEPDSSGRLRLQPSRKQVVFETLGAQLRGLDPRSQSLRRFRRGRRRTGSQCPAKRAQRTNDLLPPGPACIIHRCHILGAETHMLSRRRENGDKQQHHVNVLMILQAQTGLSHTGLRIELQRKCPTLRCKTPLNIRHRLMSRALAGVRPSQRFTTSVRMSNKSSTRPSVWSTICSIPAGLA